MGLFATALKAVLGAIFGSLLNRFFPPKTAADQKVEDLQASLESQAAMTDAANKAPSNKQELIDALKNGKICLTFCAVTLLSSCAVPNACPAIHDWSRKQQDEFAANIATLPEGSPMLDVAEEWARLRAESKACGGMRL